MRQRIGVLYAGVSRDGPAYELRRRGRRIAFSLRPSIWDRFSRDKSCSINMIFHVGWVETRNETDHARWCQQRTKIVHRWDR